ncbi:MAG: hypothetical protein M3O09_13155 [Acidobacteriota bacterium]|nr:hypothetical protein [Acidobacteriota bacterium]
MAQSAKSLSSRSAGIFMRRMPGVLLAVVLCSVMSVAQTKQAPEGTPPQTQTDGPSKKNKTKDVPLSEHKISAQEAQQLFHDVDETIAFASKDTGLPVKSEVKRRLTSREEVEAYLENNMREDKDAQRLQRSELVLKKFGLIPRDFNLGKFLVALLREQVAGYYDPKTKTVNLLDWLGADQQRPVLAHELTHALQDQSFNLKDWMKEADTDLENKTDPTPEDVADDEAGEARQAVVEGQAMVVLIDYILAPLHQSLINSSEIVQTLKQQMLSGTSDTPEFRSAPIFVKDELTFAYGYGLDFVAELLRQRGKEKAFAGLLKDPPRNTRQIMEPDTYLAGERIAAMPLPNFKLTFSGYERFDIGAMGEFDVSILIEQYAGRKAASDLYPQWRGGYYYAAKPKGKPSAPLGLLYLSRWSNAESASKFAAIYAKALSQRYQQISEVSETGRSSSSSSDFNNLALRVWTTEEGPVVIDVEGENVLVTEGFDTALRKQVGQQLFGAAAK